MNTYGKAPTDLGEVDISIPEVMYYLYLPIKLPGHWGFSLPANLQPLTPLLRAVLQDLGLDVWEQKYIYITVKKMFVSPSVTANRPGWHADGFGTNDLNYIWYDCLPTLFSVGDHFKITEGDHIKSLVEFEEQATSRPALEYEPKHLLKLDPYVVHAVNTHLDKQLMRTFIKVSVSDDVYNLKDNSINPLIPYFSRIKKYDRHVVRNDPSQAQKDSYSPPDDHFA